MDKIKTRLEGGLKPSSRKRLEVGAVIYFTALLTFGTPLEGMQNQPIETAKADVIKVDYKDYARLVAKNQYGWDTQQFDCVDYLWNKESHWNPLADNPRSSAFGIAQMLNEDSRNGYEQISNGLRYIEHRYENPCNALAFWKKKWWY